VRGFFPVAVIAAALVLASCGSHRSAGIPIQPAAGNPPSQQALSQLDALACPEGVDAGLWDELKGALEAALRETGGAGDSPANRQNHGRVARATRIVSTPPTGEANCVSDLGITDNGDGTYTLSWHYRNLGDYGQDGKVGISDITPLAQHFGEIWIEGEEDSLTAVIDGSGNERVGIEDVTPIAQCFNVDCAGYWIEGSDSDEGPFSEVGTVSVDSATGASDGRAHFAHIFTPGEYSYFRVTARDAAGTPGEPSNTVGLALQILSVTPTEVKEGTVVTFSAEVLGAGPLTYEWDFGGGAQYDTYTEPAPRVVLTRETGGFPASLTVTGPTGADTYPFTLSKLAREWKYEVVLSNPDGSLGGGDLQEHSGALWLYAYEDYSWTTGDAAQKWIVSGAPGNWDFEPIDAWGSLRISQEGTLGVAGLAGPFLDKTLTLWEKRDRMWTAEELLSYRAMSRLSFTYSGEEPFITFTLPDAPNSDWIEYFWRKGGVWERGILDEPGDTSAATGRTGVVSATDPEGSPVLCYRAHDYIDETTYDAVLKVAWWHPASGRWEIIQVEGGQDYDPNLGATGFYPDVDFRPDGKLGLVFSRFGPEIEGERDCQLVYAVFDGAYWEKEIPDEVHHFYPNAYKSNYLSYDPLGNPLIAFTLMTDTESGSDNSARAYWFNGASWDKYALDEEGYAKGVAFDAVGNPHILFTDDESKEVIIAYYE